MENGKKQQAYSAIKAKILSGELAPSTDLSEEKLIQELGISRTPIREAVQKLSEEGFVNIYPRKGSVISEISLDLIRWVYEARKINEPYIAKSVCGKLPIEWLLKMKQNFQEILEQVDSDNLECVKQYIHLDQELHETILEAHDNILLKNFMRNIYDHSQRLRIKTGLVNRQAKLAVIEHLNILDALLDEDADRVEKASMVHLMEAVRTAYHYN